MSEILLKDIKNIIIRAKGELQLRKISIGMLMMINYKRKLRYKIRQSRKNKIQ
jgi:hypothetical protein